MLFGELSLAKRNELAYAAGAQEGRHRWFLPSCESPVSFGSARRKSETGDRCEKEERQLGYSCVSFSTYSHFTDSILLHMRVTLRRRNITVLRNSFTRCCGWHLRIFSAQIRPPVSLHSQLSTLHSLQNSYLLTPISYLAESLRLPQE